MSNIGFTWKSELVFRKNLEGDSLLWNVSNIYDFFVLFRPAIFRNCCLVGVHSIARSHLRETIVNYTEYYHQRKAFHVRIPETVQFTSALTNITQNKLEKKRRKKKKGIKDSKSGAWQTFYWCCSSTLLLFFFVLYGPGTILIAAFHFSSFIIFFPSFKTQTLNLSFLVQHALFLQGYNPALHLNSEFSKWLSRRYVRSLKTSLRVILPMNCWDPGTCCAKATWS